MAQNQGATLIRVFADQTNAKAAVDELRALGLSEAQAQTYTGGSLDDLFSQNLPPGLPEWKAAYFDEELTTGHTLVIVQPGTRYLDAADLLTRCGGYDRSTARGGALKSER